ncbi:MAG: SDR family oxidoreductase [Elusimicrobia bacterium]|nr:SDR family oxidoreductase [Elusimicrobiota bacterium]
MRTVRRLMDLRGRKALVTGGAGHIGLAIEEALTELGARVAVLDLDPAACAQRARRLNRRRARSALSVPCDLGDEAATRAAAREAVRRLGGLDVLVHAAAYVGTTRMPGWAVPFPRQTTDAFEKACRVNLTAAFTLVHEAREALARTGRGSVILVGSTYGVTAPDFSLYEGTPMTVPAGYAASKGGVLMLARHLASALAPRVRVNALCPGGVWRGQPAVFVKRYEKRTPLGRMAREEDFKGAVAYLASDLSAYVTGHDLMVDGGWTAW